MGIPMSFETGAYSTWLFGVVAVAGDDGVLEGFVLSRPASGGGGLRCRPGGL